MHSKYFALAPFFAVALVACSDALAPSREAIAGRWRAAPEAMSPRGQYLRTLEFTADGRYVSTGTFRGVYPALPVDSAGSIGREYGTYTLHGDTLVFRQDSVRTWDHMTGDHLEVGPGRIYIEGPPTDPIIELTNYRLTLRRMVNPGNGYVPVVFVYERE